MAKKKEFVYDVFISYSHQNQDWVKNTLLSKLEEAGLKVFIDYRDFEVGESAPDAMERAVTTSKQTVIVFSPAYLKTTGQNLKTSCFKSWIPPIKRDN